MRRMVNVAFVGAVLLVGAIPAQAQAQAGRVEFEVGAGYARGGGMEDPAPDLRATTLGLTFWLSERWGVAASRVRSHGEDLLPVRTEPQPGDRDYLGGANLRDTRVTIRHRRGTGPWSLGVGAGMVIKGSFDTLARLHDTGDRIGMRTDWNRSSNAPSSRPSASSNCTRCSTASPCPTTRTGAPCGWNSAAALNWVPTRSRCRQG